MVDSMLIDVSILRAATGNFDEGNKLGEGGFGAVYKVLLCWKSMSLSWKFHPGLRKKTFGLFRVFSQTATR